MRSIWTENMQPPTFPALQKDLQTDVAVIGGGLAGVLCAATLRERGIDCVLLEARTIGSGISSKTTAVLSVQNEDLYTDMIKKHGEKGASDYLHAGLHALERYRAYAERIPCDLETMPAVTFSLHDRERMEQEVSVLRALGANADFTTETSLPFPIAGAVVLPDMAQFHPLKFLYGIAKGLPIYEHTEAVRVEGTTVITPNGYVHAQKVIVATHFPFINRHGLYFMKLHQQRSFVIAYENAPQLGCTVVDDAEKGIYLRNYGKYLIIGGGDRRSGKKGSGFAVVRDFARRYFPQAKEAFVWGNQDCMSLDGLPYIGAYRSGGNEVFVTTGFNEWGMLSSMIGAEILADRIEGKANPYAETFAPNRRMAFLPLMQNLSESVIGLLTPKTKRCSHMGCALHWNEEEGSWDCPCHGSRFRKNGTVIDNPAIRGIRTHDN